MKFTSFILFIVITINYNFAAAQPIFSVIDGPIYDFGQVHQGEKVEHTFTIVNTGTRELKILEHQSDCSCTVARIEPRNIQPGQEAEIRVEMSTRDQKGHQEKTVEFKINRKLEKLPFVRLEGEVIVVIDLVPDSFRFGLVDSKKLTAQTVTLTNYSSKKFILEEIISPLANLIIEANSDTAAAGQSIEIMARLIKPEPGQFKGMVILRTNLKRFHKIAIPVEGYVHDPQKTK